MASSRQKRHPLGVKRVHGEIQGTSRSAYAAVYQLVRRIPPGRVMTYGQIASATGSRLSPRAVGWALHSCPKDVPWHRVINTTGGCSTDRLPDLPTGLQRSLLEGEGISFRAGGTVDLARYRWMPRHLPHFMLGEAESPAGPSRGAARRSRRRSKVGKPTTDGA
ncbi:MAG: MGMT family protein [Acidobacteriota bacterium]